MPRLALSLFCSLLTTLCSGEESWNQFRGAGGNAYAGQSFAPTKPSDANTAWKKTIPPGLSAPVLSDGLLVLTAIDTHRFYTIAIDAKTGHERWRVAAPEVTFEKHHQAGSPAASTPLIEKQSIFVYFGSFGLLCYDHEGKEQWRMPIETPKSLYGTSVSPIAYHDQVILVLDDENTLHDSKLSRSRIIAINKKSGKLSWETGRPFNRSGWSTPTIWQHAQGDEIVVLGNGRVTGYEASTGAEKWYATGFSRETIAQPIVGQGMVYAAAAMLGGVADDQPDTEPFWTAMMHFDTNKDGQLGQNEITEHFTFPFRPELPPGHPGFGRPLPGDPKKRKARQLEMFRYIDKNKDGRWTREEFIARLNFDRGKPVLMAIQPGGHGDVSNSHVAWRLHKGLPEVPSPIFHKGLIYLVRNGGFLTAVDAQSGSVIYKERLGASGPYSASPVIANDHLYVLSERGTITVIPCGKTFTRTHQFDLRERCWVTPAFDKQTLYLRSEKHLWAFRDSNR